MFAFLVILFFTCHAKIGDVSSFFSIAYTSFGFFVPCDTVTLSLAGGDVGIWGPNPDSLLFDLNSLRTFSRAMIGCRNLVFTDRHPMGAFLSASRIFSKA